MRLAYFGSAPFAVPALMALKDHVLLVVSQPDRPTGRGMKMTSTPVKTAAIDMGLPVASPLKARDPEFIASIRSMNLDAIVVAAYGQILSEPLLNAAKQGSINLHGSILPKYRGAAPIQRCIEAGEEFTGVTLMQMDRGMDTGDIISIETTTIGPDETAAELGARLAEMAAQLAASWMPVICRGQHPRTPQNHELATHARKITKDEAELKFDAWAFDMYRKFRAFHPSPGAWIHTAKGRLRLIEARRVPYPTSQPGEVLAVQPDLVVGFASGALRFIRVRPEGKPEMSGSQWAQGARLAPGSSLIERSHVE